MKIYLGADHAGFGLKEAVKRYIIELGHEIDDMGTTSEESVDYPDFARKVAAMIGKNVGYGILICGTGIGMCMAANKQKGIRAALCHNEFAAEMARKHNDANILCLGGRVLKPEEAKRIVRMWLETDFEGGRHQRRVEKIE